MHETQRDRIVKRLIIGDCDKPFHLPECMCGQCEAWRVRQGLSTFHSLWAELAALDAKKG